MGTTGYKVRYSASGWSYVTADGAPVERAPQPAFDRFPMTTPSPWPRRILLATVAAAAVIAVTAVALVYSIGDRGDAAWSGAERSVAATADGDRATAPGTVPTAEDRQALAGADAGPPADWETVLTPEAQRSPAPSVTEAVPVGGGAAMTVTTAEEVETATSLPSVETQAVAPTADDGAVAERASTADEPAPKAATKSPESATEPTATAALAPVQRVAPTPNIRPAAPAERKVSKVSAATATVPRMQLTSGMRGLEPADRLSSPIKLNGTTPRRLHLFSELNDLNGQTVYHVWEYEGRDRVVIPLKVGADRWRAHSNKRFRASDVGQWRVVVRDSAGRELSSASFVVQ
jgi:hypothetical protein